MIPISDDDSDRTLTPYVNYLLIAVNILVFVFLQQFGNNLDFTYSYSTVPGEILTGNDIVTGAKIIHDDVSGQDFQLPGLGVTNIPVYLTLITSMFMHGGLAHIGGNMLYLWVFGDNIEQRLGHLKYLFFYLLTGVIASMTHVFVENFMGHDLLVPSLGASGAISGVLGGYILLFPTRRVNMWLGFLILPVPAFIALGIWIVFQVLNGMGSLGGQEAAGVAYSAHIGGFVAGLLLIKFFASRVRESVRNYR
ncbi:MAG TPA: rhomboid family intramembrane serine protease [Chitinophagaceae bacterium]|nr:rhomboid family intramembrane serine protease [Chitinophagaceae bacterium]